MVRRLLEAAQVTLMNVADDSKKSDFPKTFSILPANFYNPKRRLNSAVGWTELYGVVGCEFAFGFDHHISIIT